MGSSLPANIDLVTLERHHSGFKLSGRGGGRPQRHLGGLGRGRQRRRLRRPDRRRPCRPERQRSGATYVVFGQASGFAANIDLVEPRRQHRLQAQRRGGERLQRLLGGLGRRRQRRRLRRPDRRRLGTDPNGTSAGASYVVFGKASGFAANMDLSSARRQHRLQVNGAAAGDHSGFSVASAGDVNGDGFADLIVGAYCADPHGTPFGRELRGVRQGLGLRRQPRSLLARRHQRLQAQRRGDRRLQRPLGRLGRRRQRRRLRRPDRRRRPIGSLRRTYVVFGKASGFAATIDLSTLDGTNGFKLNGAAQATTAAGRSPRPATSTATASPT